MAHTPGILVLKKKFNVFFTNFSKFKIREWDFRKNIFMIDSSKLFKTTGNQLSVKAEDQNVSLFKQSVNRLTVSEV